MNRKRKPQFVVKEEVYGEERLEDIVLRQIVRFGNEQGMNLILTDKKEEKKVNDS